MLTPSPSAAAKLVPSGEGGEPSDTDSVTSKASVTSTGELSEFRIALNSRRLRNHSSSTGAGALPTGRGSGGGTAKALPFTRRDESSVSSKGLLSPAPSCGPAEPATRSACTAPVGSTALHATTNAAGMPPSTAPPPAQATPSPPPPLRVVVRAGSDQAVVIALPPRMTVAELLHRACTRLGVASFGEAAIPAFALALPSDGGTAAAALLDNSDVASDVIASGETLQLVPLQPARTVAPPPAATVYAPRLSSAVFAPPSAAVVNTAIAPLAASVSSPAAAAEEGSSSDGRGSGPTSTASSIASSTARAQVTAHGHVECVPPSPSYARHERPMATAGSHTVAQEPPRAWHLPGRLNATPPPRSETGDYDNLSVWDAASRWSTAVEADAAPVWSSRLQMFKRIARARPQDLVFAYPFSGEWIDRLIAAQLHSAQDASVAGASLKQQLMSTMELSILLYALLLPISTTFLELSGELADAYDTALLTAASLWLSLAAFATANAFTIHAMLAPIHEANLVLWCTANMRLIKWNSKFIVITAVGFLLCCEVCIFRAVFKNVNSTDWRLWKVIPLVAGCTLAISLFLVYIVFANVASHQATDANLFHEDEFISAVVKKADLDGHLITPREANATLHRAARRAQRIEDRQKRKLKQRKKNLRGGGVAGIAAAAEADAERIHHRASLDLDGALDAAMMSTTEEDGRLQEEINRQSKRLMVERRSRSQVGALVRPSSKDHVSFGVKAKLRAKDEIAKVRAPEEMARPFAAAEVNTLVPIGSPPPELNMSELHSAMGAAGVDRVKSPEAMNGGSMAGGMAGGSPKKGRVAIRRTSGPETWTPEGQRSPIAVLGPSTVLRTRAKK